MNLFSQKLTNRLTLMLSLTCCIISTQTYGLPSDREQPIHIQSDTAERNEKSGKTVYQGSVEMTQGSLRIKADSITIHSKGNKVTQIIALGNPAHYQQQPEADKELMEATGKTINYLIENEKLHLIEQASVKQGGATLKGERIDYDIRSSVITAGETNKSTRIEMTIPATSINKTKDAQKE